MSSASKTLRVGVRGGEFVPDPLGLGTKCKGQSVQFTVWFDGPRALHAFSSLVGALSPCSYKVSLTGDHYEISFDSLPTKKRKGKA